MKKALLIADSGGSKTDWCIITEQSKEFFTTESYHPNGISFDWIRNQQFFWDEYRSKYDLKIMFYGAGCLNDTGQSILYQSFKEWGFRDITVVSDLLGAAHACSVYDEGLVGILGTGSVLASLKNGMIKQLNGGHGYLLGDEGSGYYFGSMLLRKYLDGHLSTATHSEIANKIGTSQDVLKAVYAMDGKKFISSISSLFSDSFNSELTQIHRQNIDLFLNNYLPEATHKQISFVGSYAFHQQHLLKETLEQRGWKLNNVIERPISHLADKYLNGELK